MREAARRQLADYVWYEAAHQALFEIAMSLPASNARVWRDQLPARLTRRGFPDFDFAALFAEAALSPAEAEECIERLRSGSGIQR